MIVCIEVSKVPIDIVLLFIAIVVILNVIVVDKKETYCLINETF